MSGNIVSTIPPEIGQKLLPTWKFMHTNIKRFYLESFSKYLVEYKSEIKKCHNIHKGEKCFILGNGPSINKTVFESIKDEIFIGVNAIYSALSECDIECKYYMIVDDLDLLQYCKGISESDTTLFLSGDGGLKYLSDKQKYDYYLRKKPVVVQYLAPLLTCHEHLGNLLQGFYSGCTVIGSAIQLAYYMGFSEVYLLGCDCDYSSQHHFNGVHNKRFFGEDDNDNVSWNDIFSSYKILKSFFEDNKRVIYNSTVGGKLEVFKRKRLEDIK